MAARRHAADEHACVAGMRAHAHAIAEHRAAGERAGRVDGDHADRQSRRADLRDQPIDQRALAGAWRAGHADQIRAAGVRVDPARSARRAGVAIVFDQRNRTGDRARIAADARDRRSRSE